MADLVLVLGNKNLSSWSLRPWLAMRQAGIAFDERVYLFEERGWRDDIVQLSPSRKVPALQHRDLQVWDSLAICEYVAELHREAKLWPDDPRARAVARSVSAEMHSGFAALRTDLSMDVVLRAPKETLSFETARDVDRIQQIWELSRARHGADGPFLFGRFSIADAMFAPIVFRFRTYGVALREGTARAWYETMLALPAMKEWERAAEAEVREARAIPKTSAPDPTSATHCWAVIFTSALAPGVEGYEAEAEAMVALAKEQPGFLGIESARNPDGRGVTVSYWESPEAIARFKAVERHRQAQQRGREKYYARYEIRVCSVERGYKYP